MLQSQYEVARQPMSIGSSSKPKQYPCSTDGVHSMRRSGSNAVITTVASYFPIGRSLSASRSMCTTNVSPTARTESPSADCSIPEASIAPWHIGSHSKAKIFCGDAAMSRATSARCSVMQVSCPVGRARTGPTLSTRERGPSAVAVSLWQLGSSRIFNHCPRRGPACEVAGEQGIDGEAHVRAQEREADRRAVDDRAHPGEAQGPPELAFGHRLDGELRVPNEVCPHSHEHDADDGHREAVERRRNRSVDV